MYGRRLFCCSVNLGFALVDDASVFSIGGEGVGGGLRWIYWITSEFLFVQLLDCASRES